MPKELPEIRLGPLNSEADLRAAVQELEQAINRLIRALNTDDD